MGVDLEIIVGHDFRRDAVEPLAVQLNGPPRAFERLYQFFVRSGWTLPKSWHWHFDPDDSSTIAKFRQTDGVTGSHPLTHVFPADFAIRLHRKAVTFIVYKAWHNFCDPGASGWRAALRQAGEELAALAGCDRALFLPDSSYPASEGPDAAFDGCSLDEIERIVRNRCGAAQFLTREMDDASELPFEAWFVEFFAPLDGNRWVRDVQPC